MLAPETIREVKRQKAWDEFYGYTELAHLAEDLKVDPELTRMLHDKANDVLWYHYQKYNRIAQLMATLKKMLNKSRLYWMSSPSPTSNQGSTTMLGVVGSM